MKEIKAIVQPFMVGKVLDALAALGDLPGLTISHVAGWGKGRAQGVSGAVQHGGHEFAPKAKIEIVVPDDLAEKVVEAIAQAARTGNVGDGKVFVYAVEEVLKIRTGERGAGAA